ncbi:hypothetical protein PV326_008592 [Microctonus aethiopoides]|nr:hypothetical protein PV326_008592 [Microctonus aethiopoides]
MTSSLPMTTQHESVAEVESFALKFTGILTQACEGSMRRKKRNRKSNTWWTKELTHGRKRLYRAKRAYEREDDVETKERKGIDYRTRRREQSRAIRRAKWAR